MLDGIVTVVLRSGVTNTSKSFETVTMCNSPVSCLSSTLSSTNLCANLQPRWIALCQLLQFATRRHRTFRFSFAPSPITIRLPRNPPIRPRIPQKGKQSNHVSLHTQSVFKEPNQVRALDSHRATVRRRFLRRLRTGLFTTLIFKQFLPGRLCLFKLVQSPQEDRQKKSRP